MQAGEVRAGDREHVHHIIVSVIEPERIARPNVVNVRPILTDAQTPAPRAPRELGDHSAQAAEANRRAGAVMLVNWALGEDAPIYQPGNAKRIPAGSTLLFQVHYTTNGAPAGPLEDRADFRQNRRSGRFAPDRSPTRCSRFRRGRESSG